LSISFTGLNSSFDSANLIDQLVNLEIQSRVQPLQTKKTDLQNQNAFLDNVTTAVGAIKTALSYTSIKSGTTELAPKVVTSTDTDSDYLSVTTSNGAAAQSFTVNVAHLATNTVRRSSSAIKSDLTTASNISSANFKNAATLSNGTVTINGQTQTFSNSSGTLQDIQTFLSSFSGVTASYNTTSGKFELTGVTNLGSSGDTSNLLSALGFDNAQISGGNVTGLQNLESRSAGVTLNDLGLTGTKITINGVDISYNAAAAGDTLQNLVTKINNTASAKVSAAYDSTTGQLIFTNKDTGALSMTVSSDGDISALNITGGAAETLGQNAEFTISNVNGGATLVSNSNTVTGLLTGVTLDLKQATTSAVTVNIAESSTAYKSRINSVLTQVNRVLAGLRDKNDSFSRSFGNRIKTVLGSVVGTTGDTYKSMIEVGLKSNLDGNGNFTGFSLQDDLFDEAFEAAPDALNSMLWGDTSDANSVYDGLSNGNKGILVQLQNLLDVYADPNISTSGIIGQVKESVSNQIKTTDTSITRTQASIDAYEARLKKQFSQLDVLNAQMQQQQSALASLTAQTS